MSSVPLPPALVERLVVSFPGIVAGLKDSSGEWSYSEDLLKRLPGFRVYSGSEALLLTNLRAGGAGCISATVNFTAPLAAAVRARPGSPEADALQAQLTELRRAFEDFPVIAALKMLKARATGHEGWRRVLPPLIELSPDLETQVLERLGRLSQAVALL
jgi:4-hydroxy-tetrahydrodipicolinate synthase